jgi:hypothetical protein
LKASEERLFSIALPNEVHLFAWKMRRRSICASPNVRAPNEPLEMIPSDSAAACTAYATPPLLPVFRPRIELVSFRPRGRLDLDGWIDFAAICFGMLLHLGVAEIHV